MIFSTPVFLFIFLPVFIILCFVFRKFAANLFLVVCSCLFYAWGEQKYVLLLIISILLNYLFSLLIDSAQRSKKQPGPGFWLGLAVALNLALLIVFKYTGFLADSWNLFAGFFNTNSLILSVPQLHFPLGISFFTFSAVSYLIDIYRKDAQFERNPLNAALYISFFPKLLAGPIVQYRQIKDQIKSRILSTDKLAYGIRRFIIGLGKKVLIANTLGGVADQIFAIPPDQLSTAVSWLGIICYTLQIYFDFSGYSDMAIGIAKMAGFDIAENFNYPYISQSIQEFWRRWHISLSNWFRDYLYIPLGGNRRAKARVFFNLFAVFLLCGLWHGAAKTFVIWGAWHGLFIALEHAGLGNYLKRIWPLFRHVYLLLVVVIGWVIFRSESLTYAAGYIRAMFGFSPGADPVPVLSVYLNSLVIITLLVAIAAALSIIPKIQTLKDKFLNASEIKTSRIFGFGLPVTELLFLGIVLIFSIMSMSGTLNNPFIYFQF